MELGLQFTDLTCWEKTGHAAVSHEETMETSIAEYCPDMTRIVSACGQLYIREKTASEERAAVSGTVRVTVLYTSEESAGLRSLAVSVPFTCTAEDRQLASSQLIWATGRLLPGETLWDVAKQYRTDETLLRTVNQLEGEELPDKMLLIPRVR